MKEFLRQNWFKIVIVIIFIVVGSSVVYYLFWYVPRQQKIVSEDSAKQANLTATENCAQQAKSFFQAHSIPNIDQTEYNHYNQRFNKCFVEILSYGSTVPNIRTTWNTYISLYDAYEGKIYGGFMDSIVPSVKLVCGVEGKACKSITEFNNLIKQYMEN